MRPHGLDARRLSVFFVHLYSVDICNVYAHIAGAVVGRAERHAKRLAKLPRMPPRRAELVDDQAGVALYAVDIHGAPAKLQRRVGHNAAHAARIVHADIPDPVRGVDKPVWPHRNAPKSTVGVWAPPAVVVDAHGGPSVKSGRKYPYAGQVIVGGVQASVRARGKLLPRVLYTTIWRIRLELGIVCGAAAVAGNVEHLHTQVRGVGHCGPPVGQERDAVGHIELAVAVSGRSKLAGMPSVRAQYLDPVGGPVGDQY